MDKYKISVTFYCTCVCDSLTHLCSSRRLFDKWWKRILFACIRLSFDVRHRGQAIFCFAYDLSYFVNNVTPTVIHIWDISKSAPKKHQVIISKLEKEWKKEEKKKKSPLFIIFQREILQNAKIFTEYFSIYSYWPFNYAFVYPTTRSILSEKTTRICEM